MRLTVDSEALGRELDHLASFSDAPSPAVTRIVFTSTDLCARDYLKMLCAEAGLTVREDAVGNTFARWQGSEPDMPAIGTGSHTDAIPHAGRYDGTVGVLGGLEALRSLQRSGFQPRRSLELLIFTSEEPTRFGIGCLGSRLLSGALTPDAGERIKDKGGLTLDSVRLEAGYSGSLSSVALDSDYYAGFLELHIEQGPVLEQEHVSLGLVTAIAAPASLKIEIEGSGGHAGAVLMRNRHDAFCAACEVALAVESAAVATGTTDTVGTVGVCDVFPGAVNSIPSRVKLEVDVRDIVGSRRDEVIAQIHRTCDIVAARRGVRITIEQINADAPCACGESILNTLRRVCSDHQLLYREMVSRAYHDSLFMSRIAPIGMIFIPCRNGYSHRPDEYASPGDIETGVLVLAEALAALSLA